VEAGYQHTTAVKKLNRVVELANEWSVVAEIDQ